MITFENEINCRQISLFEADFLKKIEKYMDMVYKDKLLELNIGYKCVLQYFNSETNEVNENKISGYTSILSIELFSNGGRVVERGRETGGFSPFIHIIHISWLPIKKKYKVYMCDDYEEFKNDMKYTYLEILNNGFDIMQP